ncbi:MAG: CDP-diacylglycerol--serine O-phosphatidyltransferase [Porphyromonadaceae bacterium]|nr:CDP-diacylglycerol--serine O-phosphatidyltransferase [Porphyromonadaceae bacterium]
MRKNIPNLITLANLFSGCIAITMAFEGNFTAVTVWVIVAALFDFLDGVFARWLKAYSDTGKELDSLADVVSFGVAPATALFILLRDHTQLPVMTGQWQFYIPYIAFLIPLFSALRLAKFNIDERQTISFRGLPTPANGLFWVSFTVAVSDIAGNSKFFFPVTVILVILLCWLMISEIPMFSLKIKKISLKGNIRQWLLAVLMIIFVALWGLTGIALGILAYIILSLVTQNSIVK